MYNVVYEKRALKAILSLKATGLDGKVRKLIDVIRENSYRNPPPYESLTGDLKGFYSRRINIQHRLVYQVYETEKTVKIVSMWTHYEF